MTPQESSAADTPQRPAEWYVGQFILVRRPMLPAVASNIDRCIYKVTGVRGTGKNKGRQLYIEACGQESTPRKFTRLGSHIAGVFNALSTAERAVEVLKTHAEAMAAAEHKAEEQLAHLTLK